MQHSHQDPQHAHTLAPLEKGRSTSASPEGASDLVVKDGAFSQASSFAKTRENMDNADSRRFSTSFVADNCDSTKPFLWPIRNSDLGRCRVLFAGSHKELSVVSVRGKRLEICSQSLYVFSVHSSFRQRVLEIIEWRFFDKFILFLILLNSLMLAAYQYRDKDHVINKVVDRIADPIFTICFSCECALKIIAWGFIFDRNTYLRDAWNWMDFIVVVTGIVTWIFDGDNFKTLRVFRVLRPLRSLQVLKDLKILVQALLGSMPRLLDVSLMGLFLFSLFGIVGISLWNGIYFRQCRRTEFPVLAPDRTCWEWLPVPNEDRICGGRYSCSSGWCGGHLHDLRKELRPRFRSVDNSTGQAQDGHMGLPWCPFNSRTTTSPIEKPPKLFPETDFVHFDNMGGALLIVFQSMTMEGWVDIMYQVQDGAGIVLPTAYFFCLIILASFFLLNIFLAVIGEQWANVQGSLELEAEHEKAIQQADSEASVQTQAEHEGSAMQRQVTPSDENKVIVTPEEVSSWKTRLRTQLARDKVASSNEEVAAAEPPGSTRASPKAMAAALTKSTPLKELHLGPNQIGDDGAKDVGPAATLASQTSAEEAKYAPERHLSPAVTRVFSQRPSAIVRRFRESVNDTKFGTRMNNLVLGMSESTISRDAFSGFSLVESEEPPWIDHPAFWRIRNFAFSEGFTDFIMFFIAANVVTMCMEKFPPLVQFSDFLRVCEIVFIIIFGCEMLVMLMALGPKRYCSYPVTAFDGIIVTTSIIEVSFSNTSAFRGFRGFRLIRVIFKIANRWGSFRVLLKAMVLTVASLGYFAVLFGLVVYILTLLFLNIFATKFHFTDDSHAEILGPKDSLWCIGPDFGKPGEENQDCIPRAHFDTFLWASVSVFQMLSGENWNTIMYDGMRAGGWTSVVFFIFVIIFGQIMILNLFLTVLMAKFQEARPKLEAIEEKMRRPVLKRKKVVRKQKFASLIREQLRRRSMEDLKHSVTRLKFSDDMKTLDSVKRVSNTFGGAVVRDSEIDRAGSEPPPQPTTFPEPEAPPGSPPAMDAGEHFRLPRFERDDVTPVEASRITSLSMSPPLPGSMSFCSGDGKSDAPLPIETRRETMESSQVQVDEAASLPQNCALRRISPEPEEAQTHDGAACRAWPSQSPPVPDQKMAMLECWNVAEDTLAAEDADRDPSLKRMPTFRSSASTLSEVSRVSIQTRSSEASSTYLQPIWPWNYSLLVFSPNNPLRVLCRCIVLRKGRCHDDGTESGATAVSMMSLSLFETTRRRSLSQYIDSRGRLRLGEVFDNFILGCILISSVCMMFDTPLSDPKLWFTRILRTMDRIFTYIFLVEMVFKLIAMGLVFGPEAYLKSAWNWLDGSVVVISIVGNSVSFFKAMRILRAFRPLRVISRNENLKVVVRTIFASMPELATLGSLSLVFLLVIGLFCVSWLKGSFSYCETKGVGPLAPHSKGFSTPLCLGAASESVCAKGNFNTTDKTWRDGSCNSCGSSFLPPKTWRRPTADTPMCIGRCDPAKREDQGLPPQAMCPPPIKSADQFPSVCPAGNLNLVPSSSTTSDELVGITYVTQMSKQRVMPCSGPDPSGVGGCRALFCPEESSASEKENCKADCWKHPYFCYDTCKDWRSNSTRDGVGRTSSCGQCLKECEASCLCRDFCEPLIKDAAVCEEQGGKWKPVMKQNFDTVFNSMLTLFEISTTEMWVDVMYAAVDHDDPYVQPQRDRGLVWAFFFVLYIFLGNMFIINLSVGVIVENFIEIKRRGGGTLLGITERQLAWINSRTELHKRKQFFPLKDLQLQPKWRVRVHHIVESRPFEQGIMFAILLNASTMMLKVFPEPVSWWETLVQVANTFFAVVFIIEFGLKYFAHRGNYWRDSWNVFDFCVMVTTMIALFIDALFNPQDAGAAGVVIFFAMRIFRLFRILRVFRIIRFLRGLNTIFTALLLSLPRLVNVFILLLLMLILYSILGVQLFAKVKYSGSLNDYGNFRNFFWAFVTLFRSMTGETWNEIMHDLSMDERDMLDNGDWCSPPHLFDEITKYDVLNSKCLISHPNTCGKRFYYEGVVFFVSYTLLITFIVMNVLIAVILDGYLEGSANKEKDVIDFCLRVWKRYDTNCTMFLPVDKAFRFIGEVLDKQCKYSDAKVGNEGIFKREAFLVAHSKSLASIPIQYVRDCGMERLTMNKDGEVPFLHVVDLVLLVVCSRNDKELLQEIQESEERLNQQDPKALIRLHKYEELQAERTGVTNKPGFDLLAQVAASKLQRSYRARLLKKRSHQMLMTDSMAQTTKTAASTGIEIEQDHVLPPESCQQEQAISRERFEIDHSSDSIEDIQEHIVPRSGAAIDGLDEPGNRRIAPSQRSKLRAKSAEFEDELLYAPGKARSSNSDADVTCGSAGQSEESQQEVMVPPIAG